MCSRIFRADTRSAPADSIGRHSLKHLFGTQGDNGVFVSGVAGGDQTGHRGKQHRNGHQDHRCHGVQVGAGIQACHILNKQIDGNDEQLRPGIAGENRLFQHRIAGNMRLYISNIFQTTFHCPAKPRLKHKTY